MINLALITFICGVITTFGIGGSLTFATSLSIMDFSPDTLTSITRLSLFSSSLAAVIQFFIDGYLRVMDAVIISMTSLLGGIFGLYLYNRDQKKEMEKSKKNIHMILLTILGISIVLMPFIMYYEVRTNSKAFDFGSLC